MPFHGLLISLSIMYFHVHPCCSILQNFYPFYKWIIFPFTHIFHILFIHLLMDLAGSHILATVINTAMNIVVLVSAWVLAFNSLGHILRSKVAGPCCNPMLNFGRKHQNIFHSSCIILHSYQQYFRVLHTNVNTFLFVVYNNHLNGYKALWFLFAFPQWCWTHLPVLTALSSFFKYLFGYTGS